jgi:hypothetical protein
MNAVGGVGALVAAVATVLFPAGAHAQCVTVNKPEELFARSDVVFRGTVVTREPTGATGAHVIVDVATFRVEHTWKGSPGQVRVGGDRLFEIGKEYVVFAAGKPLTTSLLCRWAETIDRAKAKLEWLSSRATATVQKIPESAEWGEPVDGVQLRLAVSASASPVPGEIPLLEAQLRNQGSGPVIYIGEALVHPEIEIDGVWYVQAWAGSCCSAPREVAAGGTSEPLRLRVIPAQAFALNVRPARTLELKPGKHSVRIRTVSRGSFYVHAGTRRIVLSSNTVIVDVPAIDRPEPPPR